MRSPRDMLRAEKYIRNQQKKLAKILAKDVKGVNGLLEENQARVNKYLNDKVDYQSALINRYPDFINHDTLTQVQTKLRDQLTTLQAQNPTEEEQANHLNNLVRLTSLINDPSGYTRIFNKIQNRANRLDEERIANRVVTTQQIIADFGYAVPDTFDWTNYRDLKVSEFPQLVEITEGNQLNDRGRNYRRSNIYANQRYRNNVQRQMQALFNSVLATTQDFSKGNLSFNHVLNNELTKGTWGKHQQATKLLAGKLLNLIKKFYNLVATKVFRRKTQDQTNQENAQQNQQQHQQQNQTQQTPQGTGNGTATASTTTKEGSGLNATVDIDEDVDEDSDTDTDTDESNQGDEDTDVDNDTDEDVDTEEEEPTNEYFNAKDDVSDTHKGIYDLLHSDEEIDSDDFISQAKDLLATDDYSSLTSKEIANKLGNELGLTEKAIKELEPLITDLQNGNNSPDIKSFLDKLNSTKSNDSNDSSNSESGNGSASNISSSSGSFSSKNKSANKTLSKRKKEIESQTKAIQNGKTFASEAFTDNDFVSRNPEEIMSEDNLRDFLYIIQDNGQTVAYNDLYKYIKRKGTTKYEMHDLGAERVTQIVQEVGTKVKSLAKDLYEGNLGESFNLAQNFRERLADIDSLLDQLPVRTIEELFDKGEKNLLEFLFHIEGRVDDLYKLLNNSYVNHNSRYKINQKGFDYAINTLLGKDSATILALGVATFEKSNLDNEVISDDSGQANSATKSTARNLTTASAAYTKSLDKARRNLLKLNYLDQLIERFEDPANNQDFINQLRARNNVTKSANTSGYTLVKIPDIFTSTDNSGEIVNAFEGISVEIDQDGNLSESSRELLNQVRNTANHELLTADILIFSSELSQSLKDVATTDNQNTPSFRGFTNRRADGDNQIAEQRVTDYLNEFSQPTIGTNTKVNNIDTGDIFTNTNGRFTYNPQSPVFTSEHGDNTANTIFNKDSVTIQKAIEAPRERDGNIETIRFDINNTIQTSQQKGTNTITQDMLDNQQQKEAIKRNARSHNTKDEVSRTRQHIEVNTQHQIRNQLDVMEGEARQGNLAKLDNTKVFTIRTSSGDIPVNFDTEHTFLNPQSDQNKLIGFSTGLYNSPSHNGTILNLLKKDKGKHNNKLFIVDGKNTPQFSPRAIAEALWLSPFHRDDFTDVGTLRDRLSREEERYTFKEFIKAKYGAGTNTNGKSTTYWSNLSDDQIIEALAEFVPNLVFAEEGILGTNKIADNKSRVANNSPISSAIAKRNEMYTTPLFTGVTIFAKSINSDYYKQAVKEDSVHNNNRVLTNANRDPRYGQSRGSNNSNTHYLTSMGIVNNAQGNNRDVAYDRLELGYAVVNNLAPQLHARKGYYSSPGSSNVYNPDLTQENTFDNVNSLEEALVVVSKRNNLHERSNSTNRADYKYTDEQIVISRNKVERQPTFVENQRVEELESILLGETSRPFRTNNRGEIVALRDAIPLLDLIDVSEPNRKALKNTVRLIMSDNNMTSQEKVNLLNQIHDDVINQLQNQRTQVTSLLRQLGTRFNFDNRFNDENVARITNLNRLIDYVTNPNNRNRRVGKNFVTALKAFSTKVQLIGKEKDLTISSGSIRELDGLYEAVEGLVRAKILNLDHRELSDIKEYLTQNLLNRDNQVTINTEPYRNQIPSWTNYQNELQTNNATRTANGVVPNQNATNFEKLNY